MRRTSRAQRTWLLRGAAALLLAGTFGYLPYHLYARSGFARYLQHREQLRHLEAQNARLEAENEALEREAAALKTDMRTLERVARAELRWVGPSEVVFDLGEER
jgi:cell division protein FtsB